LGQERKATEGGPAAKIESGKLKIAVAKKPRANEPFRATLSVTYLLRPEPGPVGVIVDPLGEPLRARVLPEGMCSTATAKLGGLRSFKAMGGSGAEPGRGNLAAHRCSNLL
jgi:hypothetical protein